ncbi:MAG: Xaa-Pro peptidase family protein [Nitrospirota bacterium]
MADFRNSRLSALRKAMEKAGMDAFLVTNLNNVSYLTGFTGSNGYVLATADKAVFITDSRYETQSKDEVKGYDTFIQKGKLTEELSSVARDLGVKKIGFESRSVSFDTHHALEKALSGIGLMPARDMVEKLRVIKDEVEVARISEAVRRAEEGFRRNGSNIAAGKTEMEAAIGLEFGIRGLGAKKMPFDVIVASGPRAAMPHGIASGREMRDGETLIIDFGGEADGYQSDITRSGVIGRADGKQSEIYDIVLEAQRRAALAVRPGVPCREVDEAARGYIKSKGYGDNFGHGLGHGVGLEVHEAPSVSYLSEDTVLEGMVFTIEPGIYIPGWGGFRTEDMFLVTKDGCRVLTSLPKGINFNSEVSHK